VYILLKVSFWMLGDWYQFSIHLAASFWPVSCHAYCLWLFFVVADSRFMLIWIQLGYGSKGHKIHYSGPLIVPSGNVDQMLKDHDRQIQEAVRRARLDKEKVRKVQAESNQISTNSLFVSGRWGKPQMRKYCWEDHYRVAWLVLSICEIWVNNRGWGSVFVYVLRKIASGHFSYKIIAYW
jgi:hypothetical protein